MERAQLRAVAAAIGEPLAEDVLDGQAKVAPVAVPGVDGTAVWRVRAESGAHPWQCYVGLWPDGSARMLSADQGAWAGLIAAVGCRLPDAAAARAYIEAFLEVTRGSQVLVRVVTALGDIPWRPGSTQEEAAKAAVLAAPPTVEARAEATTGGFAVELTLVVDQRLQRNSFQLTAAGEITDTSFRVLAEGLPLPIAR